MQLNEIKEWLISEGFTWSEYYHGYSSEQIMENLLVCFDKDEMRISLIPSWACDKIHHKYTGAINLYDLQSKLADLGYVSKTESVTDCHQLKKDEPMTHEQIHDYYFNCQGQLMNNGKLVKKETSKEKHLRQALEGIKKRPIFLPQPHDDFLDATTYFLQTSLFKKETTMQQPTWEIFDDKGSKIGGYLTLDTFLSSYESNQKSLEAHLDKKVLGWTTYAKFGKMYWNDWKYWSDWGQSDCSRTEFESVGKIISYKDFTILCEDESVYKAKLVKPAEPKFKTEDLVFYKNKIWYVTGFDGKCYSLKDKNGYGDIALADDIKAVSFENWCKDHLPEDIRINASHPNYYEMRLFNGINFEPLGRIYKSYKLDKQIAILQAYIDAVKSEKKCDSE